MSHSGHEEEGSSERWLVSYADFITLLMVMFVVLYSMGQVDVKKYKQLADSFRATFSMGGPVQVIETGINQSGGTGDTDTQPSPIEIPGIPQKPPESAEVASQLTSLLASQNLGGEVSVQTNVEGVLIALSEKLLFPPGTAQLQDDAYPILDTIVQMLKPIENSVRIVGHTDTTLPSDPRYANNWELSIGRAVVIGNYLIGAGIPPQRITMAGKGEFEPIFANDTEEHRHLNSRAEIIIIYKVEQNLVGLDPNHLTSP